MDFMPIGLLAAAIGLATGIVLGLAARLGSFCTLGAIESALYGGDQRRMRMWGVVLGTAILAVFLLQAMGQLDVTQTFYHQVQWNPLASIIGGLVFGYGMALAGNCGFGALVRFGSGEIRAMVVVVVIGIVGFVTLSGPLAPVRIALFPTPPAEGPQGFAHLLSAQTGLPVWVGAVAAGLALFAWALSHPAFRTSTRQIVWGVAAGLAIAGALWGTSYLSSESFGAVRVEGHTFTAPLGRTLIYLMTASAGGISFSVGSVTGVLAGAFIGSFIRKEFRWEACEDPRELGRQITGAAMMGVGGVVALGCSIGQGVTAFSTLAFSAPVALASISLGAAFGLRNLLAGFQPE